MVRPQQWEKIHDRQGNIRKIYTLRVIMLNGQGKEGSNGHAI